ncbi:MAG TPA: nucleotidyltransferase domain-containing protein [Actinomycetota bacterium]|nr:nucleotidyltransferase domain-containing protein [Actinomycetota bacterium]
MSWEIQPVNASMFGSTARGDGDTTSDIDLFVVRPSGVDEDDAQWRSQIDAVADAVLAWTGNHASIAEIPEADVARLRRERPPVVEELVKDGITLVGESTANILRKPR